MRKRNEDSIPGVYLLLDEKLEVLYVGQSTNVQSRIRSHFNIPWVLCKYTCIEDPVERANLEHELLIEYKPLYNQLLDKRVLPNQVNIVQHRNYIGTNKESRWEAEAELISQYGLLSARKLRRLLYNHYKVSISHATIHKDLKYKKYTPYLK